MSAAYSQSRRHAGDQQVRVSCMLYLYLRENIFIEKGVRIMGEFILNVIHRPEMVPEYSATVTGHGKEEDC